MATCVFSSMVNFLNKTIRYFFNASVFILFCSNAYSYSASSKNEIIFHSLPATEDLIDFDNPSVQKEIGREYYKISNPKNLNINRFKKSRNDSNSFSESANFITPIDVINPVLKKTVTEKLNHSDFSLLSWDHIFAQNADEFEPYNRKKHFGGWIRDPQRKTCLNIRGIVLVRDALEDVQFDENNPCRVVSSLWIDPYTHQKIYDASKLQIDHMVPLKEAYVTGGWEWSNAKKCAYANFINNDFHLLAVLGSENSRKGDKSPERYTPPDSVYICRYLSHWLKIKAIWDLKLSIEEASGIQNLISEYNCDTDQFSYSLEELENQKRLSEQLPKGCDQKI